MSSSTIMQIKNNIVTTVSINYEVELVPPLIGVLSSNSPLTAIITPDNVSSLSLLPHTTVNQSSPLHTSQSP